MLLVSFKSKSLRDFALYGKRHGINPTHAERIERCLAAIEKTQSVEELVRSKARQTHGMHGAFDGTYAVSVSGPWRVTFTVKDGAASQLDYVQYH